MSYSRRRFLAASVTAAGFVAYARRADAETSGFADGPSLNEVHGYGPIRSDPYGVLDLPEGFSYRVISEAGETMADGLVVPDKFDGMGCFDLGRGRVALVRNHEIDAGELNIGPFGAGQRLAGRIDPTKVYGRYADGRPLEGGTTTVVYDLATGRTVRQHLSLAGTATNCAGGITPWGAWLSCEETTDGTANGLDRQHGWVFEVPAAGRGLADPTPITAMGRFKHEAACIDPRSGVVYMTEDINQSLFYRYLPEDPRRLHRGGRLQALAFVDTPGADTRNWSDVLWRRGDRRTVRWIDLDGVDNPHADLAERGHGAGAAIFARGEGLHWAGDHLYFTCTSGGPGRHGQIMRYVPSPREGQPDEGDQAGVLELFVESSNRAVLDYVDNITVAPNGHVIGCEDKQVGVQHIKGVAPDGRVYTLARNAMPMERTGGSNTEFAGACFSPDGRVLFVNLYYPGRTLAITGPWDRFRI